MSVLLQGNVLLVQEILHYISLLLAMQPPPLERPDFADDAAAPKALVGDFSSCIVPAVSHMLLRVFQPAQAHKRPISTL